MADPNEVAAEPVVRANADICHVLQIFLMIQDDAYISLRGPRFYPSRLEICGAVEVTKAKDPGTIASQGKYRGKKKPYGACEIRRTKPGRNIAPLADHLRRNSSRYKAAGATDIVFWILWRGLQGNTELTVRELAALAAARVPLAMDYIFIKEELNQAPLHNASMASGTGSGPGVRRGKP